MTDTFAMDFDFDGVDSQLADDPTTLVGVRYTVSDKDIIPDDNTETPYTRDYLPNLLRKWLHYVISLDDSEERTFEFTEYSDIQFRLQPDRCDVELTVTRRYHDVSLGVYVLDLKQLAGELVEATARYREWLLEQDLDLASVEDLRELQELSDAVSNEVITPDDEASE